MEEVLGALFDQALQGFDLFMPLLRVDMAVSVDLLHLEDLLADLLSLVFYDLAELLDPVFRSDDLGFLFLLLLPLVKGVIQAIRKAVSHKLQLRLRLEGLQANFLPIPDLLITHQALPETALACFL